MGPGIIVGLVSERRALLAGFAEYQSPSGSAGSEQGSVDQEDIRIEIAAGDWHRAKTAALSLVERGAAALVSIGVAGGCNPEASPGDIVLPKQVIQPDHRLHTVGADWHAHVCAKLSEHADAEKHPRLFTGPLLGNNAALTTAQAKRGAFTELSAEAVDMESLGVAQAAEEAGVPFGVIRIVLDRWDDMIPEAAMAGMGQSGDTQILPVISALMKKPRNLPQQIPGLIKLGKSNAIALKQLRSVARSLGPNLGFTLV
ncbi:MAG: hypothetical protein AAF220_09005 [Pseudomonadota bacterium]